MTQAIDLDHSIPRYRHVEYPITGLAEILTTHSKHSWTDAYPKSLDWYAEIPSRPLFALLDEAASRYGRNGFIEFLGKRYSYQESHKIVAQLTQGFRKLGIVRGSKVGLFLPNCPYFVFCYFAVLRAGGTVVTYNPLLAEQEIARQIRDSETEIMVTLDLARLYEKLAGLRSEPLPRKLVICKMSSILPFPKNLLFSITKYKARASIPDDDNHVSFDSLLAEPGSDRPSEIDPHNDIATLLYTGGTTGVPKGVCLTHDNLYANAMQSALTLSIAERGKERVLSVIPFFHAFGMTAVMNTSIALGAEMILLPRFEPTELLQTIDRKRPTLFAAVPTIYVAINEAPTLDKYDLSSLKLCNSGGDALPLEVKNSFELASGCKLLEGYGLTEASPVATFNPPDAVDKPGSVGLPLPRTVIEILSVDDRRTPLPPGQTGEICISGPQVMAGYWKHSEATAEAIIDGRLHTGDVGYIDKDGYTFLVDRLKDVILTGGYTVYPRVVEAAIHLHPAALEAAVLGLPDTYWGQRVAAFVVRARGERLDEDTLRAFLKDRLSPIEIPKQIEFCESLPRSAIGKVLKAELQTEFASSPNKSSGK